MAQSEFIEECMDAVAQALVDKKSDLTLQELNHLVPTAIMAVFNVVAEWESRDHTREGLAWAYELLYYVNQLKGD